jgi:hypothetical protein
MTDRLVTIAQFPSSIEAELTRQLLADHGIEAVVTGANASNVCPTPAIEMPELQVLESQFERAKEILDSSEQQEQEQ